MPLDAVIKTVDLEESPAERSSSPALRQVQLAERLGLPAAQAGLPARSRALVLASADSPAALVVDEVIGRRDLVAQPLHPPLAQLRQYSGAAVLEDGTIVPIVDPTFVIRK